MRISEVNIFRPFQIDRRFALLAVVCIALWTAASAYGVGAFIRKQMLDRDAEVTRETLLLTVKVLNATSFIKHADADSLTKEIATFFDQLLELPDVFRSVVYDSSGNVIWSSDHAIEGEEVGENRELREALAGKTVYEIGRVEQTSKREHRNFPEELSGREFVEIYMPVVDRAGKLVGVIELYRYPRAIMETLREGRYVVWLSAFSGSALLYLVLLAFVRRGARIIDSQREYLVQARALATISELTPIVAHNIRNPLASIRSAAELNIDGVDSFESAKAFSDILEQVDRVDNWLRELLAIAGADAMETEGCDAIAIVREVLAVYEQCAKMQGVAVALDYQEDLPLVVANGNALIQILYIVFNNAFDAMPEGGALRIRVYSRSKSKQVVLEFMDSGEGVDPDIASQLFEPFVTSKRRGTGLGLALSRRVLEGWQGGIDLRNNRDRGATLTIILRAVERSHAS